MNKRIRFCLSRCVVVAPFQFQSLFLFRLPFERRSRRRCRSSHDAPTLALARATKASDARQQTTGGASAFDSEASLLERGGSAAAAAFGRNDAQQRALPPAEYIWRGSSAYDALRCCTGNVVNVARKIRKRAATQKQLLAHSRRLQFELAPNAKRQTAPTFARRNRRPNLPQLRANLHVPPERMRKRALREATLISSLGSSRRQASALCASVFVIRATTRRVPRACALVSLCQDTFTACLGRKWVCAAFDRRGQVKKHCRRSVGLSPK